MFGKRCQLCGGKLVNNRCTLCGLDNSKTDANYRLNQSRCDDLPLTHVHTEKPQKTGEADRKPQKAVKKSATKQTVSQKTVSTGMGRTGGAQKSVRRNLKKWLTIAAVIIMFFSMIGELDFPDELFGGSQLFEENHDYDENRYDAAKRELSDTGENYSAVLDEGTYIVGVHIPEGSYTIEEGQKDTYDGFYLEDSENGIYISESFRKEEEQETVEDIRCYTGAKVSVRGKMTFSSENAQTADIIALDNPLTESVRAADGDIAGEDFPAGTYDVVMSEGDTSFAYVVPGTVLEDPEADYEGVTERIWINTHDGEFVKRNIYLPQGTKVLVEKGKVNLVPSEKIPESYEGYYYIYEEK